MWFWPNWPKVEPCHFPAIGARKVDMVALKRLIQDLYMALLSRDDAMIDVKDMDKHLRLKMQKSKFSGYLVLYWINEIWVPNIKTNDCRVSPGDKKLLHWFPRRLQGISPKIRKSRHLEFHANSWKLSENSVTAFPQTLSYNADQTRVGKIYPRSPCVFLLWHLQWLWKYLGSNRPTFRKISRKKSENCQLWIFITPQRSIVRENEDILMPHLFGEIYNCAKFQPYPRIWIFLDSDWSDFQTRLEWSHLIGCDSGRHAEAV